MTHDSMQWEHVMRRTGHRVTRQREVIMDAICAAQGHTPVGEIYTRAHRQDPTLDLSTVYRSLKVFLEVGVVVAADTGEGETEYEITRPERHHHLVCRSCCNEQEIGDSMLESMVEQVKSCHGFHVATDHLVLFGLCAACTSGPDGAHRR